MDVDAFSAAAPAEPAGRGLPETEALASLLVLLLLLDGGKAAEAQACASALVERCAAARRRSLDGLAAQALFYLALSAERCGGAAAAAAAPRLLALYRSAVLRGDEAAQAVLINALLRHALLRRDYMAAEALRARLAWPEQASAAQSARYLFYTGRIATAQLQYSEGREALQAALRKAPVRGAYGFKLQLCKWLALTRLLLGELPERRLLRGGDDAARLERPLAPYLALAAAVRNGDLPAFAAAQARHASLFESDATEHLVVRLRRTVIRAGLRRLADAYSRISLADCATRLGLEGGEEAAAFVVAKAIRDGAVEARLAAGPGGGLAGAAMLSAPPSGVYEGQEPAAAFRARLTFCLNLHNEAVQAMRFLPNAHAKAGETAEQRKERLAAEAELAEALAEGEGDDF